MKKDINMEDLRAAVKRLPNGWRPLVTDGDPNKGVMFSRMMKRNSPAEMTAREYELLIKLLDVLEKFKKDNEEVYNRMREVLS